MVKVIILDSTDSGERTLEMLRLAGITAATVISSRRPQNITQSDTFISPSTSVSAAVQEAISQDESSRVVIVNADAMAFSNVDADLINELTRQTSGVKYLGAASQSEIISFPDGDCDQLISTFASKQVLPLIGISVSSELATQSTSSESAGGAEMIARMLIQAVANAEDISSSSREVLLNAQAMSSLNLSNATTARLIQAIMNSCNIEELFPNHAWKDHGAESASACYHTVAAIYFRLGDLEAASECLKYSDQFEDSPRSLALQGLIAIKRGETLGAVAKMISSLQQYELRKKGNNGSHYLSFSPESFEGINEQLQAGLEALNRRDNDKALACFSAAVFQFDSFYKDSGLSQ